MKKEFMAAALILLALLMGMLTTAATSGCDKPRSAISEALAPLEVPL